MFELVYLQKTHRAASFVPLPCCAHLKMGFRQFDLTKRSRNKQMLDFLMGSLWLVTYRNLLETTEYRYIRTLSLYSVLRSRVLAQVPDPYYYRFENRVATQQERNYICIRIGM